MNTRSIYSSIVRRAIIACSGISLLMGAVAASGAEAEKTNLPASTHPAGATNAAAKPPPIEIPLSQFTIPSSPAEGRNPFFPDSTFGKAVAPTNGAVKVAVALTLNGISKVGNKWFALINGRTFEAGEEGDVSVPGGRKIHVLCISIKEEGATVEADGSRQELKLKRGF